MTFTFAGFEIPNDGYGYQTCCIGDALTLQLGTDVNLLDMCTKEQTHGALGDGRTWHTNELTVAMCVPEWLPMINAPKKIALTMFEATKLPNGWADILNRECVAVIVPCSWNAEVFKANGVTVPIHVCKFGVDTHTYKPIMRNHVGQPYTFLWSGTPDKRKGWDVAYQAFCKAFAGDPSAHMILHFRQPLPGEPKFKDANVSAIVGMKSHIEQINLYRNVDAFVFPSRGEGWGSPPREASATGLPTIATRYGGLAEDIDYWAMPLSIRGEIPTDYWYWKEDTGKWGDPDEGELAELMRWIFENRHSADYFASMHAYWLCAYANYDITAKRLVEIVRQYQ